MTCHAVVARAPGQRHWPAGLQPSWAQIPLVASEVPWSAGVAGGERSGAPLGLRWSALWCVLASGRGWRWCPGGLVRVLVTGGGIPELVSAGYLARGR